MSDYCNLRRASSDCVHFVYKDQLEKCDQSLAAKLKESGIQCAYVDYREVVHKADLHVANAVAQALNLQHAPYAQRTSLYQPEQWIPFLDDLITLSHHVNGVAIVIDNADDFLAENGREMFGLIEAFLIQFHHWFEKKKPCHLCFQMEKTNLVRAFFHRPSQTT